MQIASVEWSSGLRIFCPFCGAQLLSPEGMGELKPCTHVLFSAYTGTGEFELLREDVADEGKEGIKPELRGEKPAKGSSADEEDDAPLMDEQIRQARIPNSVCLRLDEPFCPPMGANGDSFYIGFCADEAVGPDAAQAAIRAGED